MITKDLGLVTAYAYAVSGGYTGTEAEFTELLGNIAKDLEEIEGLSVTVETLPPGSGATASYADGVLHLGIPRGDKGEKGDKGDKGDKGETGETGPQGPKGDPGDVSTEQLDEAISGVRTEMEESYARNDGYYEEMTVGDAEQLISTQFVEDSEPYLFRPTGGSADVGNREYVDKIVGGTVAWNQLVPKTASSTSDITNNGDGSFTVASGVDKYFILTKTFSVIVGHKYLATLQGGTDSTLYIRIESTDGNPKSTKANYIINVSETLKPNIYLRYRNIEQNTKVIPMVFDLTAMFGSTIADYIYSLEQATAGAGVAWFRNYFPKDYYPYDKGTLRSVEGVSAHETVGFNQWDEEWEVGSYNYSTGEKTVNINTIRSKNLIPCLPNTNYYFRANLPTNVFYVTYYDVNKNFVSANISGMQNEVKTTPSNARYMAFWVGNASNPQTTYKNDICINISDPTRNGEYEPYTKHTYPLDSSLTLRGVPKLVDGKLAFDGDVYLPSGEVQRRYGLRAYQSGDESLADAITDWANTVYKLATPTTETAEGYEQYQICDPSGTEEFVTDSIVQVGHETRYPANLRDKLQHLPDLPSPLLDGAYMVMVNGSQMRLEKFLIPKAPAADGTYTLKATVSGGTPVYTWEVEA